MPFQKGHTSWMKDKHHIEESKLKIGKAQKGNKNCLGKHWKLSEETKRKISKALKGKNVSEKTRQKMSKAQNRSRFKKGHIGWHKGTKGLFHHSEIARKKMSEAQKGEKNHNWKGGISFEPYPISWTNDLKESIRKRDNNTCQLCNKYQIELREKLHCHHIDYDKKNLDPKNLISLCKKCHMKTNHNRKYWIKYFKGEVK